MAEVNRWFAHLRLAAGTDRDVVVTAHAGWLADRSRGSSGLEDWPDAILTIARGRTDDATTTVGAGGGGGDSRRYLSAIGRDVVELDGQALTFDHARRDMRIDWATTRRSDAADRRAEVARARAVEREAEDDGIRRAVLRIVRDRADSPGVREIRAAYGSKRDRVDAAIAWLREEGHIAEVPGGGRKVPYRVTTGGLAWLADGSV